MNELIVNAIKNKQRLQFLYHDRLRITEPQCYGISTKGNEVLRVYQISGGSQREPLFEVSKMENLTLLNEYFIEAGPNYKPHDSAMKEIFAELV
jgi:hypothetical protein